MVRSLLSCNLSKRSEACRTSMSHSCELPMEAGKRRLASHKGRQAKSAPVLGNVRATSYP